MVAAPLSPLPFLCGLLLAAAPAQEATKTPPADDAAQGTWARVCAAMTLPGEKQEIRAFALRADVVTREGVQSNQFEAVYRYLHPHYIRFQIETGVETGRGPGKGDKAYWQRDGERVTVLSGREQIESRNLVKQMTSLAQNFLALSDPAKLDVADLNLRSIGPGYLPKDLKAEGKRLEWIEFTSRDFDLFRDDAPKRPGVEKRYRVLVGLEKKTAVPRIAVVREIATSEDPVASPILFDLKNYKSVDGYRIPHWIKVHRMRPRAVPLSFEDKPAQDIFVNSADLKPPFTPESFAP